MLDQQHVGAGCLLHALAKQNHCCILHWHMLCLQTFYSNLCRKDKKTYQTENRTVKLFPVLTYLQAEWQNKTRLPLNPNLRRVLFLDQKTNMISYQNHYVKVLKIQRGLEQGEGGVKTENSRKVQCTQISHCCIF